MTLQNATVYIVDDDLEVASDLSECLRRNGLCVRSFASAAQFIEYRRPDTPSCLLVDLHLPNVQGLQLQRTLADNGGPPVIFTTEIGDVPSIVAAVRNGALELLLKPVSVPRLLATVESGLLVDQKRRSHRMRERSLIERWESLTRREAEVFKYLVRGYLNKQAASELGITENTCQVHRGRIMKKMEAQSFAELVRMAIRLEGVAPSSINRVPRVHDFEPSAKVSGQDYEAPDHPNGVNRETQYGATISLHV